MSTWFLCKIGYNRELEDGSIKKEREAYLLDAITFTDAEARIHEEVGQERSDFVVSSVTKMNISDVFRYNDSDTWWKCKVQYKIVDEKSGKEKLTTDVMLVTALNLRQSFDRIAEKLGRMQMDSDIVEIAKSPILEVFPYKSPDQRVPANFKPLKENA